MQFIEIYVKAPKNDHLTCKTTMTEKTQMPCVFVSKPACHVMPASLSLSLDKVAEPEKCQRRQESFQQYLHTFMHSFFATAINVLTSHRR